MFKSSLQLAPSQSRSFKKFSEKKKSYCNIYLLEIFLAK